MNDTNNTSEINIDQDDTMSTERKKKKTSKKVIDPIIQKASTDTSEHTIKKAKTKKPIDKNAYRKINTK